jgi:hypothetical protein
VEQASRHLERTLVGNQPQRLQLAGIESHPASEAPLHLLKKDSLVFTDTDTYRR